MVAGRLLGTVREEDTVSRLGGDEFVIALWHVHGKEDVAGVAKKMIEAVSQPYRIDGKAVTITTSIGVSMYPEHGIDENQLMKRADRALYAVKRSGKNAYHIVEGSEALVRGWNGADLNKILSSVRQFCPDGYITT